MTGTEMVVVDAKTGAELPGEPSATLKMTALWRRQIDGEVRGYAQAVARRGMWEPAGPGPSRSVYIVEREVAR